MADQGSGISSDLVVVVSYSSNLFLYILLKRGCGGGRGLVVWVVLCSGIGVCTYVE